MVDCAAAAMLVTKWKWLTEPSLSRRCAQLIGCFPHRLRRDGCGFTQPEKNRLGLYGRLSLGFVGGAAVGTALVQEAEIPNARALFVPAGILLAAGGVAAVGVLDPRVDKTALEAPVADAGKL